MMCPDQATCFATWVHTLKRSSSTPSRHPPRSENLADLPVMHRAGLAVENAVPELKLAAHYVVNHPAGNGVTREAVELISKIQEQWLLSLRLGVEPPTHAQGRQPDGTSAAHLPGGLSRRVVYAKARGK